jgi:hypothetical protein
VIGVGALVSGHAVGRSIGWAGRRHGGHRARNCHRAWTLDPSLGFRAGDSVVLGPGSRASLSAIGARDASAEHGREARSPRANAPAGRQASHPPRCLAAGSERQVAAAMLSQDRVSGVSPLRKRPRLGSNSSSWTAKTIQTAKVRALGDAERGGVPATEGRGPEAERQMMIRERVERPSVSLDARDRAEMAIRSNRRVTRRTTD